MEFLGIKFVGVNEENGQKLMLMVVMVFSILAVKWTLSWILRKIPSFNENRKLRFWTRQGLNLFTSFVILLTVLSIWFDDPTRLATGFGLMTAGLAFALQKVVTSFAGYLVIMRGNTFSVGDRITMGGIRGDVLELGYLQTTIMEMGQPPPVQNADPAMWVKARQFTGRIVTVTNDKLFETAVFNYTRDFPFIWEEMSLPLKYTIDRDLVENEVLDIVRNHTQEARDKASPILKSLASRYGIVGDDMLPKIYYRLTDNWLEFTVRFITDVHGVRDVKDGVSRDILKFFDENNIELASATFEIVGLPAIEVSDKKQAYLKTKNQNVNLKGLS